jgi:hypothetical protein
LCFIGFYIGFFHFFANVSSETLLFEKSLIFFFFLNFFYLKLENKNSGAKAGWMAGPLAGGLDGHTTDD